MEANFFLLFLLYANCVYKVWGGDIWSDIADLEDDLGDIDDIIADLGLEDEKEELLKGMMPNVGGGDDGDDCAYKCKNGKKPQPKPGHKPTTNGCGSFGLTLQTPGLPAMTDCCDEHDKCYDTCNTRRDHCDDKFKECLDKMCRNLKTKAKVTPQQYEGCQQTTALMYAGTTALGCSPFLDAQQKACTCGDPIKQTSEKKKGQTKPAQPTTGKPRKVTQPNETLNQKKKRDEL